VLVSWAIAKGWGGHGGLSGTMLRFLCAGTGALTAGLVTNSQSQSQKCSESTTSKLKALESRIVQLETLRSTASGKTAYGDFVGRWETELRDQGYTTHSCGSGAPLTQLEEVCRMAMKAAGAESGGEYNGVSAIRSKTRKVDGKMICQNLAFCAGGWRQSEHNRRVGLA
jgi:hypothetical protein